MGKLLPTIPLNEEGETTIKINGESSTLLVDTGATLSALNPTFMKQQIPQSKENISVVGVPNQIQRVPVSKPVAPGPFWENHTFLLRDTAPVKLLG